MTQPDAPQFVVTIHTGVLKLTPPKLTLFAYPDGTGRLEGEFFSADGEWSDLYKMAISFHGAFIRYEWSGENPRHTAVTERKSTWRNFLLRWEKPLRFLKKLAGATGLEPATFGVTGARTPSNPSTSEG